MTVTTSVDTAHLRQKNKNKNKKQKQKEKPRETRCTGDKPSKVHLAQKQHHCTLDIPHHT
jgi:hypothetical protein